MCLSSLNDSDVDECALNQNVCEQQCINKEGGYECTCWPGFMYDTTSGKCVGKSLSFTLSVIEIFVLHW